MRIREKLAWVAAAVLAIGVMGSVAGVALGGPLDPPGPPAPTGPLLVQVMPGTTVDAEFTTVIVDCGDGSAFAHQAAATSAISQLNTLGDAGWSLVGPPSVSASSRCTVTYSLHRKAGSSPPVATWTPAVLPTNTPTRTPTPAPTNTPAPTSTP